ncbi:DUF3861 domain-containing protein [uncultured Vibrio sp.]|uniref:DUF3861 domain-containing protein n=1 Tax=uncultured Vibrio sp. TaxID=114054 RepID=UPI0025F32B6E|nr:DUF3861 domain-containing protein [uncultured Vibrio sp.]
MRKDNQYRITIEAIDADQAVARTLQFEHLDREDLFNVVEKMKQGSGLDNETATKVGVALRLLGPVMMHNRKHALFIDFMPHFKNFMQNLKTTVKQSIQ